MILAPFESALHVEKGEIGDYGRADQNGCFGPPPPLTNWREPKVSIDPSTLTAVGCRPSPLVALVRHRYSPDSTLQK